MSKLSVCCTTYNDGPLLRDLFESYAATAVLPNTEFLVIDDGSTDGAWDIIEEYLEKGVITWASRSSRKGCNAQTIRLFNRAAGDYYMRIDGDIRFRSAEWDAAIVDMFEYTDKRIGVLGGVALWEKQPDKPDVVNVFANTIIHPAGYSHVFNGVPYDQVRGMPPQRVDHVLGAFIAMRREAYEECGGYDPEFLGRGDVVDLVFRIRCEGYEVWTLPYVSYEHRNCSGVREKRDGDIGGMDGTLTEQIKKYHQYFYEKHGFDKIKPDLGAVRNRYKNTPVWTPQCEFYYQHVMQDAKVAPPEKPPEDKPE